MDELLGKLEKTGVGCFWCHHYAGSLSYADDLKLLCPSVSGLQILLQTCESFALEFDISFNTKKTYCICYCKSIINNLRQVYLNGVQLAWHHQVKYLGTMMSYNLND